MGVGRRHDPRVCPHRDIEVLEATSFLDDDLKEAGVVALVHVDRKDAVVAGRSPDRSTGIGPSCEPQRRPLTLRRSRADRHPINGEMRAAMLDVDPGKKVGEEWDTFVQHRPAFDRVDWITELAELTARVDPEPQPERETTAGQRVDGQGFTRQLHETTARERRDHRTDAKPFGRGRNRSHHHPRVSDGNGRVSAKDVVPQEERVPTRCLRRLGQFDEAVGIGERTERGDEDGVAHPAQ